ncbi:hypothetical protein [Hymenobacter rubidus]|uniref:hypothetical protein n=1 Tax=Hymenobacter rubidus TaxID=1441626 RepID=UPI00191CEA71|nr:hypothetical protein [Hymenobacter rubidus]
MLVTQTLRNLFLGAGTLLAVAHGRACAQAVATTQAAAVAVEAPVPPRLLVKAGLRLSHLFYQPNGRSWQLILPSSFGCEYRLRPQVSLYAQLEADISAGRAQRGRRNAATLPTPTSDLSFGARYYFNQPVPRPSAERWGNYVAFEAEAELSQLGQRGRGRQARGLLRFTPGVFALCGTQHRGPGRRLIYDLNAGLGLQAPPPYTVEAPTRPAWDVAAQVGLRVLLVNQPHALKKARH